MPNLICCICHVNFYASEEKLKKAKELYEGSNVVDPDWKAEENMFCPECSKDIRKMMDKKNAI